MSIWSVPAFLDALEDALASRDAFPDGSVLTVPPGTESPRNPSILLHTVRGAQEEGTFGPNNDEEYVAEGYIFVHRPGKGTGKDARDEANDMLMDLGAYLAANPTVPDGDGTGTVGYARPGTFEFIQGSNKNGKWCLINFDIKVTALS